MATIAFTLVAAPSSRAQVVDSTGKINEVPDFVYGANPDYRLMIPHSGSNAAAAKARLSTGATANALPDHWNNAVLKYFPPIFNQAGPSCMGSSYVGYIFTNEINSLGGADGSLPENQYAVFFNWLLTYGNSSKEAMLRSVGNPNSVDYDGRTYSQKFGYQLWSELDFGWMQGYDKWYHAMQHRVASTASFPVSALEKSGREAIKRWLYDHNGDSDFEGGGLCYVTVGATPIISGSIASTAANNAAGVVGKRYVTCWGPEMNHALTIVGYDDRIEFDLDSNNVYGEKDKDEVGAWIVMNSWGAGWENGGWIYVPYKYGGVINHATEWPWKPEVMYARKRYRPLRTLKIKMDYSDRREISLGVGASDDTTLNVPPVITQLEHFKNVGRGYDGSVASPMLGRWLDGYHYEPMEFGYDITDITDGYDRTKPVKYFFVVNTSSYYHQYTSGHIYKCSLMDYELDPRGIEIPMITRTVNVPGGGNRTILSVVVPGQSMGKPSNLAASDGKLTWQAAPEGPFTVERYYIYADDQLTDSTDGPTTSYAIGDGEASYAVAAKYVYDSTAVISAKSNVVRVIPAVETTQTNSVYEFRESGFTVPQDVINSNLDEATIEFWLKPYSLSDYNQCVGPGWGDFYLHTTSAGALYFGWGMSDRSALNTQRLATNVWKHIAITVKGSTMTLYVNGVPATKFTANFYSGLPQMALEFGHDASLNGQIDEVRIWSRCKTMLELRDNYDSEIANPAARADLLAYYKMDTVVMGGETLLRDCAGGHHAHISDPTKASQISGVDLLKAPTSLARPYFSYERSKCFAGEPVKFEPNDKNNVTAWRWSVPAIGEENVAVQQPTFTFPKEGSYDVKLEVSDAAGNTADTTIAVSIAGIEAPVADFSVSSDTLPAGDRFSFINRSKGRACTYEWSMPGADAERSAMQNAGAAYSGVGTHEVTLTVTNAAGSSSITKKVSTTVIAPVVDFSVTPYHVVKGDKVYLADKSRYTPNEWSWLIENAKKRVCIKTKNSSYTTASPGYYDVTLTAVNSTGRGTMTQKQAFVVSNAESYNGLLFGGKGQKVTMQGVEPDATSDLTIDWWMNPSNLATAVSVTADATSSSGEAGTIRMRSDSTGILKFTYTNTASSLAGYIISGEWHHYAVIYSKGRVSFYRDGKKISTAASLAGPTTFSMPGSFVLGDDASGMTSMWDELRIWGTSLGNGNYVKSYCNQPIENVDSAMTANKLLAYYNFNQSSGDVLDVTSRHIDGARSGFGPDGDAWNSSVGVFTLNFANDLRTVNVTAKYLKNYQAPFINTGNSVNGDNKRFLELETCTSRSPWVIENSANSGDVNTCVHVDTQRGSDLTAETEYNGFASSLGDHRLYQVVTLPAGWYRFSIENDRTADSNSPESSVLAVSLGDTLCSYRNIASALAYSNLRSHSVSFKITEGSKVALGIIYNMSGMKSMSVSKFKLERVPTVELEGDGVTSIVQAVHEGRVADITAEAGGVRIVSDKVITLRIYNILGQCLLNEYVSGSKYFPLPKGVYIVNGKKIAVTR